MRREAAGNTSPGWMTATESASPEPALWRHRPRSPWGKSIVQEVLDSPGHPLDPGTRNFMQSRFDHDFSHVRVHSDDKATEAARAVGVFGFTVGQDVVLAAGRYAPYQQEGRQLLAHELAHVVQQSSASNLSPGEQLRTVASEGALEKEADISASCLPRAQGVARSVIPTFPHPTTRLGTVAIQRRREGEVTDPGAKRAKAAEQLVEKLKAAGAVYKQEPQRDWNNEKLSDCSKFVQWALEASGEGESLAERMPVRRRCGKSSESSQWRTRFRSVRPLPRWETS